MKNRYEKLGRFTAKLFGCLLSFLDIIVNLFQYLMVAIVHFYESGWKLSLYFHKSSSSKNSLLFKLNNYILKSYISLMKIGLVRDLYFFGLFPISLFYAIKYKSIILFIFLITPWLNIFVLPFVFALFVWQNKETHFVCNIELLCAFF